MTEQEYIKNRLDDQIKWYSDKSAWNQKWYKRFKVLELVLAVSIPALVACLSDVVIGVFGALVAVCAGVLSIYKFQENWVKYRTTSETLKHQKHLYLADVAPYDGEDKLKLLVQNVEHIISQENSDWQSYSTQAQQANA